MGCGTSKSAQVVDTNITTEKKLPPDAQSDVVDDVKPVKTVDGGPLHNSQGKNPPKRSSKSTKQPLMESTNEERVLPQEAPPVPLSTATDTYAAFEVDMSLNGSTLPAKPPPRRLEKLEDAPKVTAEMLSEKQRTASERKLKELDKRAHNRLSKKERLRKEVMDARDPQDQSTESKEQNTTMKHQMIPTGESEANSFNEMEVDDTFNDGGDTKDSWGVEGEDLPETTKENNSTAGALNRNNFSDLEW